MYIYIYTNSTTPSMMLAFARQGCNFWDECRRKDMQPCAARSPPINSPVYLVSATPPPPRWGPPSQSSHVAEFGCKAGAPLVKAWRIVAEVRDNARNLASICCTGVATTLPRVMAARVETSRSLATTVAINSFLERSVLSMHLRTPKTGPNFEPMFGRKAMENCSITSQWM